MECEIDLAFKHPNSSVHNELAIAFKSIDGVSGDYVSFISKVAEVSGIENLESISESTYLTLLGNCDVKANDKKISIGVTTGSDFEETVPEFINFVLRFGGKPLACKVEMDESRVTFKHSKAGIQVTHKDLWDE